MIIERNLKPPKDIAEAQEKQDERVGRFLRPKNLRLSDKQTETIEREIKRRYESWDKQTKTLRRRLVRWNDLLEGVVDDTNFPFEGASNITTHYAAGLMRTLRSTFNKAMYQDEDLAVPVLDPELTLTTAQHEALQEGFNYTLNTFSNAIDALKSLTVPTARDGTGIISGAWERIVETAIETRTYRKYEEFARDYPDAESAGLDEEAYKSLVDEFILNAEPELIVTFDVEVVKYDAPYYRIESRARFVNYPTFVHRIADMEMYGTWETISMAELKKRKKFYYSRGFEKVESKVSQYKSNEWDRSRSMIDGVSDTVSGEEDKPINKLDLVIKMDMNEDGIPEKYIAEWAVDSNALLSFRRYDIRKNIDICVAFRMFERENRFDGNSLIGDGEDCFNQIDTLHRHRNNVRVLTTSPQYLINSKYKEQIDLGRAENVVRPGVSYWVDDIDKALKRVDQPDMSPNGDSLDEEQLLSRYLELVFGPTQGLSGQQTQGDKNAPARKTQMLMMQANQRIDDYMDNFRKSMPDFFDLHDALIFQYYGKEMLKFDQKNKVKKFPIALLAHPGLKWAPKRRSVNLTPEFSMARLVNLTQVYAMLLPRIMAGDDIAIEMWNRQVLNSGEPQGEKLFIDDQKKQQIAQQAQAMVEMRQKKLAQQNAEDKGKEAFHKKLGAVAGEHVGKAMSGQNGVDTGAPS